MTDLEALLWRVKAASGEDRELDFALEDHLNPLPPADWADLTTEHINSPHYTASIDAALALVEIQGFCVHMLHMGPKGSKGGASVDLCPPNKADENYEGEAATPSLAILAALLSALIAKAADG